MSSQGLVIVGGGLAGATAAETIRSEGYDGPVVIVGAEPELPYERPPLSKGYLMGSATRDSVFERDASWYEQNNVELRTGVAVEALDPVGHELRLADGSVLSFDKVLLATGASPRRLSVPGADLAGVHYLRQLPDADALRAALADGGRRVVVVGGGWIGLEVTSAARGYGNEVTVVEPASTVLKGPMGEDLGNMFADLHREHGVRLLLGQGARSLAGSDGRVTAVETDAGERVEADLVVVGVGATPNVQLAQEAGLDVDNGVLVDASLRTSHPDVYAAGDIARWFHPFYGRYVRVEHWDNARRSGPAAARAMLGGEVSYDHLPFFFTDQYDLGMEYTGDLGPDGFDRLVFRGDREARTFVVFWLKDGRVVAGMNVNVWDVSDEIVRLIRSRSVVDVDRLADPDVPLGDLG